MNKFYNLPRYQYFTISRRWVLQTGINERPFLCLPNSTQYF